MVTRACPVWTAGRLGLRPTRDNGLLEARDNAKGKEGVFGISIYLAGLCWVRALGSYVGGRADWKMDIDMCMCPVGALV